MQLHRLFHPSSIAVIGVSEQPNKVGHLIAKNMLKQGYADPLYFVHPKAHTILGKPVYHSLDAIPGRLDVALLAVPAELSLQYLDSLHEKGVQGVVLYAAGFRETPGGNKNEKLLEKKLQEYGMSVLGPNCLGYVNTSRRINATFLKDTVPKGNIGFISQSGALGSVTNDMFQRRSHLGFSYFISIGNKTSITESDVLEYLGDDEHTEVIALYLEDVVDGDRFMSLLTKISRSKPVVILKSGTTQEGAAAARSHTGGLVGDDAVFRVAIRQAGGIRAASFEEFLTLLTLLSTRRIPKNRNTLVLSNAGGAGVLLADELVQHDLPLVTISPATQNKITDAFGDLKKVTVHNPIDLLGDASAFDYQTAISLTLEEKDIGSVIVLLTPQANTEIEKTARVLASVQHQSTVPIYPIFMGDVSVHDAHGYFERHTMASFRTFDTLPSSLAKIAEYTEWCRYSLTAGEQSRETGLLRLLSLKSAESRSADSSGAPQSIIDVLALFRQLSIPVADGCAVSTIAEAEAATEAYGYPVVMKTAATSISHKTEKKGVITGIADKISLRQAFSTMKLLAEPGEPVALIQKTMSGSEYIAGAKRDPVFGTVILFGLGGIYTELLQLFSLKMYPLTKRDVEAMIDELHLTPLIAGYRSLPPLNVDSLFSTVSALGAILQAYQDVQEVEINPLILHNGTMIAVDGRIILS